VKFLLSLLASYSLSYLGLWAYSFQTFTALEVLGAAKMNQIEVNIRDHRHGIDTGLSSTGNVTPVIGSDADGDIWYRASSAIARLAKGAANTKLFTNAGATAPEWASGLKVGSFTRDLTTASGSQSVTGVGFKPSAVIFWAHVSGETKGSLGFTDGTTSDCFYNYAAVSAGAWAISAGNILHPIGDLSNLQNGALSSLDADGFTISWTKTGSPTGSLVVSYLAFR
jgi:hypothetical protein